MSSWLNRLSSRLINRFAVCLSVCIASMVYADDGAVPGGSDGLLQGGRLLLPDIKSTSAETEQLRNELKSYLSSNPEGLIQILEQSGTYLNDRLFNKAVELISSARSDYPNNQDLLVRHAEALAGLNGGSLEGEAFDILSLSLDIDHKHEPSLWLMGLYNQQAGNHEAALIIFHALKQQMGSEGAFVEVIDRAVAISIAHIDSESSPVTEK